MLADPAAWRKTSCETSDQLEKQPGYFYLRRTVRWRYVPLDQPFATPIIAPAKPRIIENGFLDPGLLAELLANKYLYHLPFHRQHLLNLRRHGVDIPENTMLTFLDDGRVAIDNNSTERDIRPSAVGKRNWMFNPNTIKRRPLGAYEVGVPPAIVGEELRSGSRGRDSGNQ